LPDQIILDGIAMTDILTAGMPSALAGIALSSHMLSGEGQIIHLELLVQAIGGNTLGTIAGIMR
jgi:hypothetical protein